MGSRSCDSAPESKEDDVVKLEDGSRCDDADTRVYRQSREAGRGCLVSRGALGDRALYGARDYHWVLGFPAEAREIHPPEFG